jgi:hypothetical protein
MSGVLEQHRPADTTVESARGEAEIENFENVATQQTPATPKDFEVLTAEDNPIVYLKGWRLYITTLRYISLYSA